MNLSDIALDLGNRAFDRTSRPLRLRLAGRIGRSFEGVLVPQRLDIAEAVCDGITAHVTCLATRADLPLRQLIGVPVEVQIATDGPTGEARRICVLLTEVRQGQSDGGLTVVQLTGRDVLAALQGRRSNQAFHDLNVPDILRAVLDGWRKAWPALALAFDYSLRDVDESRYPRRACTLQIHRSDADFVRDLCARNGIAWFFRAAPPGADGADAPPVQQLVFFDDVGRLAENSAGPVRYHRRSATEARDTVGLLAPTYTLATGAVVQSSYDHEASRVDRVRETGRIDQGDAGNALAAALEDARIELPHVGDTWDDHQRLARLDIERHEGRAQSLHGVGGVRAQSVGEWNRIDGHPLLDRQCPEDREYVTVRLQHWAEGSLPKALDERAQILLAASEPGIPSWAAFSGASEAPADAESGKGEHRYANRFLAMPRSLPIVPAWDPEVDLQRMPPMTGTVVGPEGAPVYCDALGRVRVRLHGFASERNEADTAWVRVNFLWAGEGFGILFPLRVGMEVSLAFEQGDPSRPMIVGTRYHRDHPPARFDHRGSLPANHALSGIVTRELGGQRQQQLRFNDSPGRISTQLASDHGATQLNLGQLATPMDEGRTEPRGEGFEIRSDKAGAIRSAEALLITTWRRVEAADKQLGAREHHDLLQEGLDLSESLGDHAAEHQGAPVDTAPQARLKADIETGTEPAISLTAPAGVAVTTPKTLLHHAGANIDSVARANHQQTAGGRHVVNAGQGVSTFAHRGGIRSIAHHGELLMQSQHDDTRIDSAKDIKLAAAGGRLVGVAQDEITFVTAGGAYLRLKGGEVEIGAPGPLTIKTAGHHWDGPASLAADLPTFGENDLGRTPRLLRPTDGGPVEGAKVLVSRADGVDVSGRTDAAGRGPKVVTDTLQRLKSFFYLPRS